MAFRRLVPIGCVLVAVVVVVPLASAQDFVGSGLKVGDRAEVTTKSRTYRGTIRTVSSSAIEVDDATFPIGQVLKIDRLGDSVWQGTAVGVTIGAALGATVPRRGCTSGKKFKCIGGPAAIFGLLGAWIDYKRVGRTTLFERSISGVPVKPTLEVEPGRWLVGVSVRVGG